MKSNAFIVQRRDHQGLRRLPARVACLCVLLILSFVQSPSASADSGEFPRNTFTDGKRNYVWVGESVYNKVTNEHEVPEWLVGRVIYYARDANFASNYTPYYMTIHEYECNKTCTMTDRKVNIRLAIDWTDGKPNHGILRTMYCHMQAPRQTCPGWLQSDDPYLGPPGPQYPGLPPQ